MPASPDNTVFVGRVIAPAGAYAITDANGDRWSITPSGQVAINGVADPTTARVTVLAWEDGKVWQQNADGLWWYAAGGAGSWQPPQGTHHSPIPPGQPETPVQYLDGAVVDYVDSVSPRGYNVSAVDDGEKGIVFNDSGRNVNAGTIRNAEGTLTLNVSGVLVNTGSLVTQGGIGPATTAINLAPGSVLRNTGLIAARYASSGGVTGRLAVTGAGRFVNAGSVDIAGGSNTDVDISGRIVNSGQLTIEDSFGTRHSVITSAGITNTGTIENHNQTLIQWGYTGPPQDRPDSLFVNHGVIRNLLDVGQLTLAAGAFTHNADGSLLHDYHGTLVNDGQILAQGGGDQIEIAAPLRQDDAGHIDIQDNATVQLDASSTGGTIRITSGMLAFGGDRILFHGPAGATGFDSTVVLDGARAVFNFGRSDITEEFRSTSPTSADLIINLVRPGPPEQVADIHLSGAYHQSQFNLSGTEVFYTRDA